VAGAQEEGTRRAEAEEAEEGQEAARVGTAVEASVLAILADSAYCTPSDTSWAMDCHRNRTVAHPL
jgi:hypothetical protein